MPWATSNRKDRLPPDWPEIRIRIFQRDKYRCQWRPFKGSTEICGQLATDVDHIERGDNHADSNLQALCAPHHRRKSSSEGRQAQLAAKRQITKRFARQPEKHPGRLEPEHSAHDHRPDAHQSEAVRGRPRPA